MSRLLPAFLASLPLVMVPGADNPAQLPQSVFLLLGVLVAWLIHERAPAHVPQRALARLLWPALCLLGWAGLSSAWAHNRYEAVLDLLRWSAALLAFVLVLRVVASVAEARLLLVAMFASAFVVSVVGLLQHVMGWDGLPQPYPPAGTLANKNVASAWVAMALPLGAAIFAVSSPRAAWVVSGAGAVSAAYVLHAGSRAAWLAVFLQALAGLFVLRRWDSIPRLSAVKRRALAFGAAVFLVLVSLRPAAPDPTFASPAELWRASTAPLLQFLHGGTAAPEPHLAERPLSPEQRAVRSVEIRLAVWRNALEMLRDSPLLGVGLGNFEVQYPRFSRAVTADGTRLDQRVEAAHNDYLQLAVELGVIGVLLLGWLSVAAVRAVTAGLRETPGEARALCLASGLGLAGILLTAAISPTFNQPSLLAALAALVGVAAALGLGAVRQHVASVSRARALSGWAGVVRWAALAASLPAAGYWGYAEIQADRHVLAMARADAAHDWPSAVREGLQAREWNPFRKDVLFGVASAYLRLGQPQPAIALLRELLDASPNDASALGNLGIAYLALGDHESAGACLRKVLLLRPDASLAERKLEQIAALRRAPRDRTRQP